MQFVICEPNHRSVKLIGLSSCAELNGEVKSISQLASLEKDLHCISPEMGSVVKQYFDFRSDFCSLGVIFCKMLTGKYPLHSDDKMDLILLHVSQEPLSVQCFDPSIPKVISQMISKLLNKNTDERYQTAKGLIYDLDVIMSEYDADPDLNDMVLAENDTSSQLCLINRMHDRNGDYDILCSALKNASSDSKEMCFATGDSGTGKC